MSRKIANHFPGLFRQIGNYFMELSRQIAFPLVMSSKTVNNLTETERGSGSQIVPGCALTKTESYLMPPPLPPS